jgi:enamine deaminase RidA (YjgF/YER057c/UK114 family)
MVFSSTITGADPESGKLSSQPEEQVAVAFRNLQQLLDQAQLSHDEIGFLRIAVSPAGSPAQWDASAFIEMPWRDTLGPLVSIHRYPLPHGELVQLQVTGVRGERWRAISLPGLPMRAARIGNLMFSSIISGIDPDTGGLVEDRLGQVRQAFRHMEALVRQAGGTMDDVAHVFIYVRDREDNDDVL